MRRRICCFGAALALCLLLLCACGAQQEPAPTPAPTPLPTAEPTPEPPEEIELGGLRVPADAELLDLDGTDFDPEALLAAAERFPALREIRLGLTGLSGEELARLREAYPGAAVSWQVALGNETLGSDTESLDLSELTGEGVDEACLALSRLPALRSVDLIPADGSPTPLTAEELGRLAAAAPQAQLDCCFELYGQLAGPDTEELRYTRVKIGNEGIARFREALPYLRSLKLLRLKQCGVDDYDAMDALRADFPAVNVVWSVEIGEYPFMTDTILINSQLITDQNAHLLRYMHDVLYLDVGHNTRLTNLDFVRYFPKLNTVIISITRISDISALAECPELEFFECFSTPISDISCLKGMENLEYLNLGDMPNLSDISPVYGLPSLKLVRMCQRTFDHVTQEQIDELQQSVPDCVLSIGPGHSGFAGGWRYNPDGSKTERYELLCQQMLYKLSDWDRQSNSPTETGDRS